MSATPTKEKLAAVLNGTMYIYGGRSKTSQDQTSGTWSTYCPFSQLYMSHRKR